MSIILTADKVIASELVDAVYVTPKTILAYDGNENVEIIVASRMLAKVAQGLKFPCLKFVQLLSAGFEGVNVELYRSRGVVVSNAASVYGIGMAEYIVYAMLMNAKKYNKSIKNSRIRYQRGYRFVTELSGKCVGILGCGAIGSHVAKRLSGFDMSIIGYDPFKKDGEHFDNIYDNLDDVLPLCDYIVIAVPYNASTDKMVNSQFISKCKKSVTIVNVGRKAVINDADLLFALKNNKDMTAILDMFEVFPNPITNPYRRLCNVKVLPGVTAISNEIDERRVELIKENVNNIRGGEPVKFAL